MKKTIMPANWRVLALYAVLMALMQFEWLRFAPITSNVAEHYGVPLSAIGDLALVFPFLCVLLALPAGALLDALSVRTSLRLIAAGMSLAAVLRLPALTEGYAYVMAGQIVFSLLQPLVLGLVAKLSNVWFEEEGRLQATALSSMALFVGIGLAFVVVPVIGGQSLWLDVFVLVALLVLVWFLVPADVHQLDVETVTSRSWGQELMAMLRNPVFLLLTGYFFFANGYFNAISTWLEPILAPQGIEPQTAGIVALGMLVAGIIAMAMADKIARKVSLRVLMIVASIVPMGVTLVFFNTGNVVWLGIAAALLGITLLAPLPLLIQTVVDAAGGGQDGTAASVFWMIGNGGAVVYMGTLGPIADSGHWFYGEIILLILLGVQLVLGGMAWRFPVLSRLSD